MFTSKLDLDLKESKDSKDNDTSFLKYFTEKEECVFFLSASKTLNLRMKRKISCMVNNYISQYFNRVNRNQESSHFLNLS